MSWTSVEPSWRPLDVDAASLWAASGAQWISAPGAQVPVEVVRTVTGLVSYLDAQGANLHSLFPVGGLGLLAERAALLELPPVRLGLGDGSGAGSGAVSCGGASRLLACADGWIALTLARTDDLASLPAWLGVGVDDQAGRAPWNAIADVVGRLAGAPLVTSAAELGLACSAVGEVTDDRAVLAARLGDAPARPLAGAVVANLSSLWAGPLAADILARAGATVINVESIGRPDGARGTPAFFEALHGRSSSVALDLQTSDGRQHLAEVLVASDVVIEGSRPRALEQIGIAAADVVRNGPKVWLSVTGHGRSDRHGQRVGFGDDAAAAGGLVDQIEGYPVFVADAIADPLTGLTAAATIVQLLGAPGRFLVDVALSRVARSVAGEWAAPATSTPPRPRARLDAGRALPLGRDTEAVLAGLDRRRAARRVTPTSTNKGD